MQDSPERDLFLAIIDQAFRDAIRAAHLGLYDSVDYKLMVLPRPSRQISAYLSYVFDDPIAAHNAMRARVLAVEFLGTKRKYIRKVAA